MAFSSGQIHTRGGKHTQSANLHNGDQTKLPQKALNVGVRGAKDAAALRPAVWKATFCRSCKIVNVQLMKPSKSASIEINYTEWYRKKLT